MLREAFDGVIPGFAWHTKDAVRTIARRIGLRNSDRQESQDACFSTKGTAYPEILRQRFNKGMNPGPFLDEEGRFLGMHEGIHRFTVGQRRGLGVALGSAAWVKSIDPKSGAVFLTTRKEGLIAQGLIATGVRWHALTQRFKRLRCSVQVRYNQAPVFATVEQDEPGTVRVRFERPTDGRLARTGRSLLLRRPSAWRRMDRAMHSLRIWRPWRGTK